VELQTPQVGVRSGLDLGTLSYDVSIISSIAIILGTLFVVVQIRQTNRMIRVSGKQAEAAAIQAKLTTEQLKQDHELANMDLIMRLYEFANTAEVQAAWLTVLNSKISTYEDFESLSKSDQVAFFQIGALFESLGVLVERDIVNVNVIEDMFLTRLAWKSMKPFVSGVRERYGEEENYAGFQRLYEKIVLAEKKESE
jgi:hypothetical protein